MSPVPVYNPSPFPVPAVWILRIDPFFYGGVTEMDGGWYGARYNDRRVPYGGPFDTFQDAQVWVVTWARAALEAAQARAADTATATLAALIDLGEEFDQ